MPGRRTLEQDLNEQLRQIRQLNRALDAAETCEHKGWTLGWERKGRQTYICTTRYCNKTKVKRVYRV